MSENTITKIIWQYSEALPQETMRFLLGIADDYRKVKNYTYSRYSGINSIEKLTPGYDILNEMRRCGLRQQLDFPVVYYELAILDAVKDIKTMWTNLKDKICGLVNVNDNLSPDEKSYLRIVLKIDSVFAAILKDKPYDMPKKAEGLDVNIKKLHNLIRRQVRKYKVIPKATDTNTFKVSPNGYSYKDNGIRLVSRVDRKRVFIPLKDSTCHKRQLIITVAENSIAIAVPVEVNVVKHEDYINTVYIHIGYRDMFTLSTGTVYGSGLGMSVTAETERLVRKNTERYKLYKAYAHGIDTGNLKKSRKILANNMGKIKYNAVKKKSRAQTETFINHEINRMLKTEKPARIVIANPPYFASMNNMSVKMKNMLSRSFMSYIRGRLEFKCRLNGVELIQVNSKDNGVVCSCCGGRGERHKMEFKCNNCGYEAVTSLNSAKNIERKYING